VRELNGWGVSKKTKSPKINILSKEACNHIQALKNNHRPRNLSCAGDDFTFHRGGV
jgi:hypothetical protein